MGYLKILNLESMISYPPENMREMQKLNFLLCRLCGSVLDQEQPSTRSALVSKIWGLLETKAVPTTVNHYNALLRVHLENGHQFAPEEVCLIHQSRSFC